MKVDSYLSKHGNSWNIICLPTGRPLLTNELGATPPFRLIRQGIDIFRNQDRFLMNTAQVIEDIQRHGVARYTVFVRFRSRG